MTAQHQHAWVGASSDPPWCQSCGAIWQPTPTAHPGGQGAGQAGGERR